MTALTRERMGRTGRGMATRTVILILGGGVLLLLGLAVLLSKRPAPEAEKVAEPEAKKGAEPSEKPSASDVRKEEDAFLSEAKARLDAGGKADERTEPYGSRLHEAAARGYLKAAAFLFDRGASVNAKSRGGLGRTPLQEACGAGWKEMAELLLSRGATIGINDDDGKSTMYYAARSGNREIVDLLLAKGAKIDSGGTGGSALDAAVDANNAVMANYLKSKGADSKPLNRRLLVAARDGDSATLERLVQYGADVNGESGAKQRPLFAAAEAMTAKPEKAREYRKVLVILLNGGADYHGICQFEVRKTSDREVLDAGNEETFLDWAVRKGDKEVVERLLALGANVNEVLGRSNPLPIHWAAYTGNKDILQLLLDKGADLGRDGPGGKVLHCAARGGNPEIIKILVARGADVDERSDTLRGALFPITIAAECGNTEAVRALLDAGADPDADTRWATPLYYAAKNNHVEVVKLLVARKARIDAAKDSPEWHTGTPLMEAASAGYTEVVKALLQGGADSKRTLYYQHDTALVQAIEGGHVETVKALLDRGADPNFASSGGTPPLQAAIWSEKADLVRLLVERGADVNVRSNRTGYTPLHVAVTAGDEEMVKFLIAGKAAIGARTKDGRTMLHLAAHGGWRKLAEFFLDKGAGVDACSESGDTALHEAARAGCPGVVDLLLARGAAIDPRDDQGRTPLYVASVAGLPNVVSRLLAAKAKVDAADKDSRTPLLALADDWVDEASKEEIAEWGEEGKGLNWSGRVTAPTTAEDAGKTIELLVEAEANTNLKTRSSRHTFGAVIWATPAQEPILNVLIRRGLIPVARRAIEKGADVKAADVLGVTALHWAASRCDLELVKLLVEKGASVDALTGEKLNMLHAATIVGGFGRSRDGRAVPPKVPVLPVVEFFVSKGLDVNAKTKSGRTPLSAASWRELADVVEFLRAHGAKE